MRMDLDLVVVDLKKLRTIVREEVARGIAEQNGENMLSTADAAAILECATRSILYYEQRSWLKNYGFGRKKKYKRSEVLELKARGTRGVQA
jgi:hypothetical protein